MKSYYRIMLGKKSKFAQQCYQANFIGASSGIRMDLTGQLADNWRDFNRQFIPVYLAGYPHKTKVAAGLACGALHTVCKGIQKGDVVLCPNGNGSYWVGEVVEDYSYHAGEDLPHRRTVNWFPKTIERSQMSKALQNSAGSTGTVSTITKFAEEIEALLGHSVSTPLVSDDETVEDVTVFALEKYLEAFLVDNWESTDLGKKYDIYEVDGDLVGQQYLSDTGPIDILAISKDRKELLVVELKKGRASDKVVGQIQRYMGYVLEELAEPGQLVKGVIIALEDDLKIRRALAVAPNIDFYRYKVSFKLFKD